MSKQAVGILVLLYFLVLAFLFQQCYSTLRDLEKDMYHIMHTWCGPETAQRFKDLRAKCEGLE